VPRRHCIARGVLAPREAAGACPKPDSDPKAHRRNWTDDTGRRDHAIESLPCFVSPAWMQSLGGDRSDRIQGLKEGR